MLQIWKMTWNWEHWIPGFLLEFIFVIVVFVTDVWMVDYCLYLYIEDMWKVVWCLNYTQNSQWASIIS